MTIDQAIILSAGKGSRLYPHTEDRPKCLLDLSGKTLLEWQLDTLHESGITKMVVVTGFHHDLVEQVVAARGPGRGEITLLFNPFYQVADNLASVWMARTYFNRDTLLLNGDTLVSTDLVRTVLRADASPIAVTTDRKDDYDADDMKVMCEGNRLLRIGKALPADECNAESIGLIALRGSGRNAFIEKIEEVMTTDQGVRLWYLSVIDMLADGGMVGITSIVGHEWQEVDYLADLDAARDLTSKWRAATA